MGNADEFLLLNDAFEEFEQMSDEEVELVLLPPDNVNGDTDNEVGNDAEVTETCLYSIQEAPETVEICTSRKTTRTVKKKLKHPKLEKNVKTKVAKEKEKVRTVHGQEGLELNDKIDELVDSAEILTELHKWKSTNDEHEIEGFAWKTKLNIETQGNSDKLNRVCQGKMPVEIFEPSFNENMQKHIQETVKYAQVCRNDSTFNMTEYNLRCYVGTLFLSGYHSLPQQHLYWERSNDVDSTMVYQHISKNKFRLIKKYTHLADNSQLDKSDKYAKVRPLYDTANKSLQVWILACKLFY